MYLVRLSCFPSWSKSLLNDALEHFSTPLHFAVQHYSLDASLIPFPSGTGHLVTSLQSNQLDIAVGLTEGFVRALGNQGGDPEFQLVGTYVESPLCWAISTGARRELDDVERLKGKRIGVSRIGRLVHTGAGLAS